MTKQHPKSALWNKWLDDQKVGQAELQDLVDVVDGKGMPSGGFFMGVDAHEDVEFEGEVFRRRTLNEVVHLSRIGASYSDTIGIGVEEMDAFRAFLRTAIGTRVPGKAKETLQQIAARGAKSTKEFIASCETDAKAFEQAGDKGRAAALRKLIADHLKPMMEYDEEVARR